jgi:hypothetical protein
MATAEDIKIRLTADNQASKNIQKVKGDIQDLGMSSKQAAATLAASNGKITKNFSTLGRSAGMAGMQVQQFVGQVQMGTNPLMALSQQGADLGFVLGVPLLGAIVGIGSSIAMTLIPSLNEAEVKLSDMRDSLKGLTGDFKNMSAEMQAASVAILVGELTEQTLEYNKAVKAREEAEKKVVEAQKDLAESKAYTTIKDASDTLAKYNTELNILVAQEAIANGVRQETQATLDRVIGATSNLTKEQEAQNEAHAEYIQQLEEEMLTFGMNADQKARYKMLNMPEEYRQTAIAIHEKIMAQKAEQKQFEDTEKARTQSMDDAKKGLQALGQYNKTAFAASKAYNIAEAVMNTYTGATKALATYPPPYSYIAAAGQVAFGMAQVANIKSQSFSGRAVGGRVEAGSPYMVGEQGREMFIPSTRGQIVKNSDVEAMGGSGGSTNISFTVNAVDTRGFDELLTSRRSQIVNMVNQAMNDRGRTGVV